MIDLILQAYGIRRIQLSIPPSQGLRRYDIVAKMSDGTNTEQFRVMLQNLLALRFRLRIHREPRQFDAYRLVVAKNGPKLRETTFKSDNSAKRPERTDSDGTAVIAGVTIIEPKNGRLILSAGKMHIAGLANILEAELRGPVLEATGLQGEYDIKMQFSSEGLAEPPRTPPSTSPSEPAPNIFQALEQQLGLSLEKSKVQLDVLVVEHLEEVPTDN